VKVGKYIPGVRIPIVDETGTPPPDAYLVLAWNFLREFLQKQRNYIMNGGEFIVPIPSRLLSISRTGRSTARDPNLYFPPADPVASDTKKIGFSETAEIRYRLFRLIFRELMA